MVQLAKSHNHQIIQFKTKLDESKHHYILTNLGKIEVLIILWLAEGDVGSRFQVNKSTTDVSDTEDMFTVLHLDHYDYSTHRDLDDQLEEIRISLLDASVSRFLGNRRFENGVFKEFVFQLTKVIISIQLALGDQTPVFKLSTDFLEELYQRARNADLDYPQLLFLEENVLNKNQSFINKMIASVIPLLDTGEYDFQQVHNEVFQA